MSIPIPNLLDANETAEWLGVSVATLRRLVAAGSLPVVRYGPRARLRFDPDDVERFLDRSRIDLHDQNGHRAGAWGAARSGLRPVLARPPGRTP